MGKLLGLERRSTPTFAEPPIPAYLGASNSLSSSGVSTPDRAMAIPTVWQCVSLLAGAVAMLPLESYRQTGAVTTRMSAQPALLTSPSAGMTQSEWLHQVMVSALLRGNAFGIIGGRDALQRPTQIDLVHPDRVQTSVDSDAGVLTYRINGKAVDTHQIWHLRGMTMPGSKVGLSPISYAAAALGLDLAARKFGADYLSGGGIPKAVLTSEQTITNDNARTLKERFLQATRDREPMVLGLGTVYSAVQVNPEESQFLATQQASVAQIARYFSIPPKMIGGSDGSSLTYANVEQLSIDFLTYAVAFWLKRIEDALFPLLPAPQFVRFDTEALLRTDSETQAKVYVQLIAGKVLTRGEVRAKYNRPPMTEQELASLDDVPGLTITPKGDAKALPAPSTAPAEATPTAQEG